MCWLPVRFDQCGQSGLQLRCKVKHKLIEIQNNCTGLFEIASLAISSRKHAHKGINTFYTKHKRRERIWSYSLTRKSEEGL